MKSKRARNILAIILVLFLAFGFGASLRKPPASFSVQNQLQADSFEFWVNPGEGIAQVASSLESSGAIKSKFLFTFYSILTGDAFLLQPGLHHIALNDSIPKIIKELSSKPDEVVVIIFPGMTTKEAEEKLVAAKIISSGELVNFNPAPLKKRFPFLANAISLEGFIMPDTYKFMPYSDVNSAVVKLLDNFQEKTGGIKDLKGLTFLSRSDIFEKIIIASILEKEIPDPNEMRIAAGILQKRLNNNIPLQVDATIFYFKCQGEFIGCGNVTRADYKASSPFNTYLNKGLPPAPISNPDTEAIEAALNPIPTAYWYYLSDPITKKTIFSSTFDEHNGNRYKYLKM